MPLDRGQDISLKRPSLLVLGTRGIPAAHGGFETFAQHLALGFVKRGWDVTVYCQKTEAKPSGQVGPIEDHWRGVRRVSIETGPDRPITTMEFDWKCVRHAIKERGVLLVLGYNTALFTFPLRLAGRPLLMNMDGIEWKRDKWSFLARVWFYINEWFGARISTKLIADHPAIADHLATRRKKSDIVTIPYGADVVSAAPTGPVEQLGLAPGNYFLSVGRIEPENSIVEMITAYTKRERRAAFVCVGPLEPKQNSYHAGVIAAANGRVLLPGAIFDAERLQALRFHALAYCHGHTVGGTNPSLVEALGAGNAVIARDNVFNRWVAGPGQFYFSDTSSFCEILDRIESAPSLLDDARKLARTRFAQSFEWRDVLDRYEALCLDYACGKPSKLAAG